MTTTATASPTRTALSRIRAVVADWALLLERKDAPAPDARALAAVLRERGIRRPPAALLADFDARTSGCAAEGTARAVEQAVADVQRDHYLGRAGTPEDLVEAMWRHIPAPTVDRDAAKALLLLRERGYAVAVAVHTTRPPHHIKEALAGAGLGTMARVVSSRLGGGMPWPEYYRHVLRRLAANGHIADPGQVLWAAPGDGISAIGARAERMQVVTVAARDRPRDELLPEMGCLLTLLPAAIRPRDLAWR
jgi:beta-phosphoglucomutase-like phosphatase (HAD superfamily)